jgi:hypothetical protein
MWHSENHLLLLWHIQSSIKSVGLCASATTDIKKCRLLLVCFNESGSLNTYFGSAPGGRAREVPPHLPPKDEL